ncbi:hypothetical protein B7494_g1201 [Chlorociboria aeruginascens]|nr:hypothetical protein B7494_g1201 [Chlorociboria aeruginascens]
MAQSTSPFSESKQRQGFITTISPTNKIINLDTLPEIDEETQYAIAQHQSYLNPWTTHSLLLYLILVLVFLNATSSGFDGSLMGSINASPQYQDFFHETETGSSTGLVFILYNAASTIGCIFGGPIMDFFGRRKGMQSGCLFTIVGAVLAADARNLGMFKASRFLLGFGIVIQTIAAPVYVTEMSPPQWRGRAGGLYNTFYFSGSITATGVVYATSSYASTIAWRLPLSLQVIPPTLVFLGCFFIPESPRWLFARGKKEEGQRIVFRYHGGEENEVAKLELREMERLLGERKSLRVYLGELWDWRDLVNSHSARWRSGMVTLMTLASSFTGNDILTCELRSSWTRVELLIAGSFPPDHVGYRGCCICEEKAIAYFCVIYWAVIGSMTNDWIFRRTRFVWGSFALASSLALVAGMSSQVAAATEAGNPVSKVISGFGIFSIFLFGWIFSFVYTPNQASTLFLKVMNQEIRAKGISLHALQSNLATLLFTYTTSIALGDISWKYYFVWIAVDFISGILWFFFAVETVGRTIEELDSCFGEKFPPKASWKRTRISHLRRLKVPAVGSRTSVASHSHRPRAILGCVARRPLGIPAVAGGVNWACLPTHIMSYWSMYPSPLGVGEIERIVADRYHREFASKDLRSVGNYTLGKLIGKGSFGKVYLATHKLVNGKKVVLKSANKNDSNLAREIHHHRQFLHPHIARLYEVIVTETLVWLVLEYCPGDELYNYLLKNGALPVEKVQKIFTQLVGAVAYVHISSCVHRDLKLENILLDKNENVKLCDFGFTREYEGKASYLQTFCGTVCYSAPEMLKGEKYAGEKVDVWSLGVILYALLCGELPFDEDDDNETRTKILSSEPKWPDHLTPDARSLLSILLSKRPLIRPAISDILTHPFLAEFAPQQQVILKIQQPAPFTTGLEKETLERMRSAGVDIDQVIENVLARRCDVLSGWWSLLIEKEERKHARKERKRKEREAEVRASRRLSGASSRMALTLTGVDEEGQALKLSDPPKSRGRKERRSAHYPDLVLTDLPGLPENDQFHSPGVASPPLPVEKDSVRSASSSRHRRPVPPPKEGLLRSARSRGSTLQLVTSNPDLLSANTNGVSPRPRRRHQYPFINQLAHWKHWIIESAKRAKSPGKKTSRSTPNLHHQSANSSRSGTKEPSPRPATSKSPSTRPALQVGPQSHPPVSRIYTTPNKRSSLSPSPLTPHSAYRRPSSGLRGRKSTSSSVSSIRSIHHHHHTHSKASSTSSNGSGSISKTSLPTRSPHHSVKVLPATPTTAAFPSNIRVVRQPPISSFNEGMSWGPSPLTSSPGSLVFAKRKKNLFKGPTSSPVTPGGSSAARNGSHSRSASVGGRRSGEIIEEEDEDEIEEVEAFSPVTGPGEEIVDDFFPAVENIPVSKVGGEVNP